MLTFHLASELACDAPRVDPVMKMDPVREFAYGASQGDPVMKMDPVQEFAYGALRVSVQSTQC